MTSQATGSTAARRGRRNKGKRHSFMSRVPEELAERVIAEAEASDLTYSDYIALVLAEKHDFELPAPYPKPAPMTDSVQEEIPMQNAS